MTEPINELAARFGERQDVPPIIGTEGIALPEQTPGPWGFWATIGWTLLIGACYLFAQGIAAGVFIGAGGVPNVNRHNLGGAFNHGGLMAFATVASAPVVVCLCIVAARVKGSLTVKDYFGLHWPGAKTVAKWLVVFLVFLTGLNVLLSGIQREVTDDFMRKVIETTSPRMLPILWLALVVAAPVSEEMLFRGFLFAGLERSRLGGWGTVLVTALVFAAIHVQYDIGGILTILGVGLFFGVARLKTGSLWVCILLHGVLNLLATIAASSFDEGLRVD